MWICEYELRVGSLKHMEIDVGLKWYKANPLIEKHTYRTCIHEYTHPDANIMKIAHTFQPLIRITYTPFESERMKEGIKRIDVEF